MLIGPKQINTEFGKQIWKPAVVDMVAIVAPRVFRRLVRKMRVLNETGHADTEVRNLVAFACKGINMARVMVVVTGSGGAAQSGRVYREVPDWSFAWSLETVDRLVIVSIAAEDRYPTDNMHLCSGWVDVQERDREDRCGPYRSHHGQLQRWSRMAEMRPRFGGDSPRIDYRDWREGLVGLAAHQACHIDQYNHHIRSSDEDAERFAATRVIAYRAAVAETQSAARSREPITPDIASTKPASRTVVRPVSETPASSEAGIQALLRKLQSKCFASAQSPT